MSLGDRRPRRLFAPLAALAAAGLLAAPLASAQQAAAPAVARSYKPTMAVPNPKVTGPIPARAKPGDDSHDYPWMTTFHNLSAVGYVEEEFFFEGTARQFTTGANAQVRPETTPYKSRIIVRRPKDMRNFNGTVLAEWQNVTAGFDLDAMWGGAFEHIVREGYVWVGISAQRVGLEGNTTENNGLKDWSPTRYGTLNIPNDNYSFDIYAQGMQALDNPQGVNLLGGAKPKAIVAMGASQSAGRLQTYLNSLHGYLGGPVDAYLIMIGGSLTRDDISVPVFRLYSETEIRGSAAPKADSDIYRHWEVAGASHSTRRSAMNSGPLTKRDKAQRPPAECRYPTHPRVPMNYVLASVYDHVSAWARDGVQPPKAPPAQRDASGPVRDDKGNLLGGIRLTEFDPAVALNVAANSGSQFCNLYGRYEPFSDEVIAQLYPTHADYVKKAKATTAANLKAGFIRPQDAKESNKKAEQSIVGRKVVCAAACRAGQDVLDASYMYLGLSKHKNKLTTDLAKIIVTMAEGDYKGGAAEDKAFEKARKDTARWMDALRNLERRGELSDTAVNELLAGAEKMLNAMPPAG